MAVIAATTTTAIVFLPLIVGEKTELQIWLGEVGIAITLTMLGYNLLGEGLRDALDPRLGGSE